MLRSRNAKGFLICLGVTLLVLVFFFLGSFEGLESKSIDYRFRVRSPRVPRSDIVVVTIDEESIEALGRWPWPRSFHASLARRLTRAGAKAVAFDSIFSERDAAAPSSDRAFADAAEETGKVAVAMHFRGGIQQKIFGRDPLFPYSPLGDHAFKGFVNFDPDADGVSRHSYLYAIVGDDLYPSLAVAAYAVAVGKSLDDVLPMLPVVVSKDPYRAMNELFINYAFYPDRYPYATYSYAGIVRGTQDMLVFKDKIVFVGATAAALGDVKVIPFISKYPGVMIHANVLDNLLSGNGIREVPVVTAALYLLLVGLLLGFFIPRLSPWGQLGTYAVVTGGSIALSFALFDLKNLVFPLVTPFFVSTGAYVGMIFYRLLVEEKEKRKIKGSFRQYLSPKIIDIITQDPAKLKLGGEEKEVSIFFLDIAGFTSMSEALKPTQLVEVMNRCLTQFSGIILKHDGLINKYIGDCIMAFWNAPADQPRHAAQACLAALECIESLPELNRQFQEQGLPSIDCRVGINTGTVVVGNMGSNERFDYTVMGDAVNLASRLEGANKQYHTRIMISDTTFDKAKEEIEARDLDLIRVKGKREPRKVFEVISKKDKLPEELLEGRRLYHEGLRFYRQQKFNEAIRAFESVYGYLPGDLVTGVYIDRAHAFLTRHPPEGWDGVFEMTTK